MIWFILPFGKKFHRKKDGAFGVLEMLNFRMLKMKPFSYDGYDLHVHSPLFKNEKYLEEGSVIPAVDIVHRMQTGRYYYKRLWPRMDKDE